MVYTKHFCAKCASGQIRHNCSSGGRAKYPCKACGHQGYFQPAAVEKVRQCVQVDQVLLERVSLRSIMRLAGVARNTIAKRMNKSAATGPVAAVSAVEKGPEKAVGGVGVRRNVDVCGP